MKYRILGPFDRYNYGDLLFPLVLSHKIKSKGHEAEYYGVIESDLSKYGAIKTYSIYQFYRDIRPGDKVIIAGGESLCTSWSDLYSYLSRNFDSIYGNRLSKALDRRLGLFSNIARYSVSGKTEYPFAFSPEELKEDVQVRFNAVGGSAVATWSKKKQERFVNKIRAADLVGVRDELTQRTLKKMEPDLHVELVPDSAIMIASYFSDSVDFTKILEQYSLPEKYIFFQVGNTKYADLRVLYEQLAKLANETGYSVVLCPIGHALGHEDDKPLRKIYEHAVKKGDKRFILIAQQLHVFDLMTMIQGAQLYIGTSLHGLITSLSFGTPYVSFNKQIKKTSEYLASWGVCSLDDSCKEQEIYEKALFALNVDSESILNEVQVHKRIYGEFIERLIE